MHRDESTMRKKGAPKVATVSWHGTCLLEGHALVLFFLLSWADPSGTWDIQESTWRAWDSFLKWSVYCRQPKHIFISGHLYGKYGWNSFGNVWFLLRSNSLKEITHSIELFCVYQPARPTTNTLWNFPIATSLSTFKGSEEFKCFEVYIKQWFFYPEAERSLFQHFVTTLANLAWGPPQLEPDFGRWWLLNGAMKP